MRALLKALRQGRDRGSWRAVVLGSAAAAVGLALAVVVPPALAGAAATAPAAEGDSPEDAHVREELARVREELANARALGDAEQARARLNAALIDAEATGDPTLLAEANLARGDAAVAAEEPSADAFLQAAYFAAAEAGETGLAIDAATSLAAFELNHARVPGAWYWIEHAQALGGDDDANVAFVRGSIRVFDGDAEAGLADLRLAIALAAPPSEDGEILSGAYLGAGQAAVKLGQTEVGREYFSAALALHAADSPGASDALFHLIDLEIELGEREAALEHLQRAVAIEAGSEGTATVSSALRRMQLGNVLRDSGRLDEALEQLQAAARIMEAPALADAPDRAVILEALGLILEVRGDVAEALQAYERALVIREATGGRAHEFTGFTLLRLSSAAATLGDLDKALAHALEAREVLVGALGPDSVVVGATHGAAAEIHLERGDVELARRDAERAVELYSSSDRLPDELARARLLLADLLARSGEGGARARTLASEAEAFYASAGPGFTGELAAARKWIKDH